MTSALQNRLVGTVILVALAVIFLPDFLDGKKTSNDDAFVSVPAAPARKPIVNPEPFPSDRVANATQHPVEIVDEPALDDEPAVGTTAADAVAQAAPAAQSEDELASQTVVEAPEETAVNTGWVVQLGSFRHQKNVKDLLDKLEKAGYRAFSRPIQTSSGPLTKVFVGPDLNRDNLEAALPHLQEVTELKGKITSFRVE